MRSHVGKELAMYKTYTKQWQAEGIQGVPKKATTIIRIASRIEPSLGEMRNMFLDVFN